MSVEHVCLGRIRLIADTRMPQGLSGGRIESHKIASTAGENQFSGGGQQSGGASTLNLMSPDHLTGPIIDSGQKITGRPGICVLNSSKAHRSSRIDVNQIGDRV